MAEHQVRGDLLGVLRGPQAEPLLRQSLRASGMLLRTWELEQVHARPGAEVSARYRVQCAVAERGSTPGGLSGPAELRRPTGPARPKEPTALSKPTGLNKPGLNKPTGLTELTMIASTVELSAEQRAGMGAVRAESPQGTLHLWVHPVDPELPGLLLVEPDGEKPAEPATPTELQVRLSRALGEQSTVQELQMLVLRPLRRAVYRAVVSSRRGQRVVYLKVVRPSRVAQLLQRHRCSGLIPAIADAGDGILILDQAPGLPLTEHLHRACPPAHVHPLNPRVAISALETLRPEALELPARVPPAHRLTGLAESAIAVGADRRRVQQLCAGIEAALRQPPGPLVPTHGDFHPANLFLDAAAEHPSALIDADTVGPGHRVDDLATMLGHLFALPSFDAEGYAGVPDFAERFHAACLPDTDPDDLHARTAAVLLSLLPGTRSPAQQGHYLRCAEGLLRGLTPGDLLR